MAKVTVVQVIYNHKRFIQPVFESVFNQTFKDFEVVTVISGNDDGGKEYLLENFPKVQVIDPGYNIGFAAGHNLVFRQSNSDFFQLVNPDLILEPDYIEKILKAFDDPKVGAVTGKLYQVPESGIMNYELWKTQIKQSKKTLDTTGVVINKSGRARDRGQHEIDTGQYDNQKIVQAVSAAGAMYRAEALKVIKLPKFQITNDKFQINSKNQISNSQTNPKSEILNPKSDFEYFDEDFHSYWEDVDLSWRMINAGWKCVFVPQAVGFHGRAAAASPGGYKKFWSFVKFHRALPLTVRQLNYKNHILMHVKNSPWFYPQFFIRELAMFFYVLLFEPKTLKVLPEVFKSLPKIWKKRKFIQKNFSRG